MKQRNYAAKYAKRYNKSVVMKDRKRENKKNGEWLDDEQSRESKVPNTSL